MASPQSAYRKISIDELIAEARERFGVDPHDWAFACPNCGDVATMRDFIAIGMDPECAGQECIGRYLGALAFGRQRTEGRGCDWAAYGFVQGPWEIVAPARGYRPERRIWAFPLADAPAASGAA